MKAKVNKDVCIGCGACTAVAQNIFQIGDDGLAETINPDNENEKNSSEEDKDDVLDAAEGCPVGAIEVSE